MAKLNPLVKNMVFTALKSQIQGSVKNLKTKDGKPVGELITMSFLIDKEKTIQRLEFEHYKGDSVLSEKERNNFGKLVGINIDNEIKDCKFIFCVLDFSKKEIRIQKIFNNDVKENIVL